ncbi:MAG: hypothetical protein FJ112_08265, partial [Deltaproteobacteria bacterium]|nr:hypothetical protein [Deltaproteobacteria bacterium]
MKTISLHLMTILSFVFGAIAIAAPQTVRWTGKEDKNANLVHVLDVIRSKTGVELSQSNFMLVESRKLATSHFLMLAQTVGGMPIRGLSVRLWTSLTKGETIQIEATVDGAPAASGWTVKSVRAALSSTDTMELVRQVLKGTEDPSIRKISWTDMWEKGQVVRVVKVNSKRGKHRLVIGVEGKKLLDQAYEEFPQSDRVSENSFSLPVQVYPIYEEPEGEILNQTLLPRISSELRYLNKSIRVSLNGDPLASIKNQRYIDSLFDPLKG